MRFRLYDRFESIRIRFKAPVAKKSPEDYSSVEAWLTYPINVDAQLPAICRFWVSYSFRQGEAITKPYVFLSIKKYLQLIKFINSKNKEI